MHKTDPFWPRFVRTVLVMGSVGFNLIALTFVGAWIGAKLEEHLASWGALLGIIIGLISAVWSIRWVVKEWNKS